MADSFSKHKNHLHISSVVRDIFPDHVAYDNPDLVEFARKLLESMEDVNKSTYYANRINILRDLDETDDDLLSYLQSELGAPIPRIFAADPRLLYKHLTELYKSRGTPDSIKSFFRLLFDDEVEIYFPKEDMLIPSDGKYYDQTADVEANPDLYTPLYTYTIGSVTDTVGGADDIGRELKVDNPLVFVNGVQRELFTFNTVPNYTTNKLDYSIVFPSDLSVGDVVKIYRTGAFTTNDGFLDDYKKLQDSFFYQKFSYVLRTGTNADVWKNAFNRLVHPAGFIFFGEILLLIELLGRGAPNPQPGFQVSGLPFPIVINPVDAGVTFVKTRAITYGATATVGDYHMQVGSNNILATFWEKEYKPQVHTNLFGPAEYFERFKFLLGSPISDFANYTTLDAINKVIDVNMSSTIEISN